MPYCIILWSNIGRELPTTRYRVPPRVHSVRVGPLTQCRMSILRNYNVLCRYVKNMFAISMSILK